MINKYLLIAVILLNGCSLFPDDLVSTETNSSNEVINQVEKQSPSTTVNYYDKPLTNNVNDYAQWLIQYLFSSMDFSHNVAVFMVYDLSFLY
jgi:hypothetical protein